MSGESRDAPCIHRIFEARVDEAPDAIALDGDQGRLAYGELNERANRLAHFLQACGVGPDDLVAICADRSLELVTALIGILKAGGGYVPLDPSYPPERLDFMLSETKARVVLTQEKYLSSLPPSVNGATGDGGRNPYVVCLDSDWNEHVAPCEKTNPSSAVTSNDVAYVTYTSGSTGTPKGALIPHRSIPGFMFDVDYVTFDSAQTLLLASSISWDAMTLELWPALLHGGRCVLRRAPISTPQELRDVIDTYGVTLVWLTSSLFNAIIDTLPKALANVRQLLIGGEALSVAHVRRALELLPDTRIVNGYGPSECTVFACCYPIPRPLDDRFKQVPIGRPIGDRRVYVLDKKLKRVPIGVVGELYIGGPAVPHGYLNRSDLNAERFVFDSFGPEPNAKLYKTGDMVRFRRDGTIEFVGRQDDQIKIRGYRVELGEIENTIVAHPAVRVAVVLAREDEPGAKRLVAYVEPNNGRADLGKEVRGFLKERLPDYLRPSVILTLKALPITSNGKVDRDALPAPGDIVQDDNDSFVAPRTETEERLAEVWGDILGVGQVGIHDNFFELGGDSILSIQIVSKAGEAGIELTPKQLFEKPTIAELAEAATTTEGPRFEQGEVTGPVPLTPIQYWFFNQQLVHPEHYNHAVMLTLPSSMNPVVIDHALQCLVNHHDSLRTRFTESGSGWQQEITPARDESMLIRIDLADAPDADKTSTIEARSAELQTTMNLSDGPLLRAALFENVSGDSSRLLLIIHHLVVDVVSWRVLLDHLQLAITELSNGSAVALPAKTCSFKHFAESLSKYAGTPAVMSQAEIWLADAEIEMNRLPIDHSAGNADNTYGSMATISRSLSMEETRSLLEEVPGAYNTQVNDVVLSAVVQAFREWTGSDRLRVDMEGHGRSESIDGADLSRTVGWFTAIYPVLLDASCAADPEKLIKSTKERLRRISSGGTGYGLLRYLGTDTNLVEALRKSPNAEVSYNYIGHFDQVIPESGMIRLAHESFGPLNHPSQARPHLVTIHAMVTDGCFRIDWLYSEQVHFKATIEQLADQFLVALCGLIDHCLSDKAGGYTPSDFALAGLDQEALDRLKSKYETKEDDA